MHRQAQLPASSGAMREQRPVHAGGCRQARLKIAQSKRAQLSMQLWYMDTSLKDGMNRHASAP